MQECEQEDTCGKADVVFVLDSSGSLGGKNWWRTKQFAIDVTKGLKISETESRVGMVAFSNTPTITFSLGEYNDHASVEDAIWAAPWIAKTTNTKDALYAASDVFNTTGRPGVKHIIVLVTDGISNKGKEQTIPAAEEVQAEGIEIFSIGIGRVDADEVTGIASEKKDEHRFLIESFTNLTAITSSIAETTCEAANRTECDEWGPWGEECVLDDPDMNCGPGQYVRTRECRFYLFEGAAPTVRLDLEGKPCDGPECPTTTPAPTTPPSTPPTTPPSTPPSTAEGTCDCDLGDVKESILMCAQLLQDLADGGGQ